MKDKDYRGRPGGRSRCFCGNPVPLGTFKTWSDVCEDCREKNQLVHQAGGLKSGMPKDYWCWTGKVEARILEEAVSYWEGCTCPSGDGHAHHCLCPCHQWNQMGRDNGRMRSSMPDIERESLSRFNREVTKPWPADGKVNDVAETLENFKFRRKPGGATYPWDLWLNGEIWKLQVGVDIPERRTASKHDLSFRAALYSAATRKNKKVQTELLKEDKRLFLVLQAYQPEEHASSVS